MLLDTKQRLIDLIIIFLFSPIIIVLIIIISIFLFMFNFKNIFFFQKRLGKDFKEFNLVKFRTIEKIDDKEFFLFGGKFLRRSSLDELPQIFNVIINQMSIVGPRPLPKLNDDSLNQLLQTRLRVLPGLTGLTQIEYKGHKRTYEEKFKIDKLYVENQSIKLYFYIIFKTFLVLLKRFRKNKKALSL